MIYWKLILNFFHLACEKIQAWKKIWNETKKNLEEFRVL